MLEKIKIDQRLVIQYGDLIIDSKCFIVMLGDRKINLYPKEFEALFLLAEHPGWIFSKEQIYKKLYGEENVVNINNIIYCLMHGLRKKLKSDSKSKEFIQTIKGVGYRFVVSEE